MILVRKTTRVKKACWSFGMGTKTNSQVKVQDEVNLHNQEKRIVSASWMEMVRQT
jgi:hypothetical protein